MAGLLRATSIIPCLELVAVSRSLFATGVRMRSNNVLVFVDSNAVVF